jgi:hypothetical protein
MIHDHCRDALRHEIRRRANVRVLVSQPTARARAIVRVRVDVDEAGRDIFTGGVNDALRVRPCQGSDGDDPPAADADIGRKPWITGAIEHAAVSDEKVERRRGLLRR